MTTLQALKILKTEFEDLNTPKRWFFEIFNAVRRCINPNSKGIETRSKKICKRTKKKKNNNSKTDVF